MDRPRHFLDSPPDVSGPKGAPTAFLGRQRGGRLHYCCPKQRPLRACPQPLANAAIAASRAASNFGAWPRRWNGSLLASLWSRLWDLLAKDYAATCPDASSFDVAISALR